MLHTEYITNNITYKIDKCLVDYRLFYNTVMLRCEQTGKMTRTINPFLIVLIVHLEIDILHISMYLDLLYACCLIHGNNFKTDRRRRSMYNYLND